MSAKVFALGCAHHTGPGGQVCLVIGLPNQAYFDIGLVAGGGGCDTLFRSMDDGDGDDWR